MERIKVVEIRRTCFACPSQWEGWTEDGRPVYIRYRWGRLSVCIGPAGGDIWSAVDGEEILGLQYGPPIDGCLTYTELKQLTQDVLELPEEETG